jgi:hypothetical protein
MGKKEDHTLIIAKAFSNQRLTLEEINQCKNWSITYLITEMGLNDIQSEEVIRWCALSHTAHSATDSSSIIKEGFFDSLRSEKSLTKKKTKLALNLIKKSVVSKIRSDAFNDSSRIFSILNRLDVVKQNLVDEDTIKKIGLSNTGRVMLNHGDNAKKVVQNYNSILNMLVNKIEAAKSGFGLSEGILDIRPDVYLGGLEGIFSKSGELTAIREDIEYIKAKGLVEEINMIVENITRDIRTSLTDSSLKNRRKDYESTLQAIKNTRLEVYNAVCDELIELVENKQQTFKNTANLFLTQYYRLSQLIDREKAKEKVAANSQDTPFKSRNDTSSIGKNLERMQNSQVQSGPTKKERNKS